MGKFSMLAALGVLALFTVARAMPQPGSDSSSEMPIEAHELMDEMTWNPKAMEESPENNEIWEDDHVMSPYKYSDVVHDDEAESIKAAKMCADTVVELKILMSFIETLSYETRYQFFPLYCSRLEKITSCMDDVLKAARFDFEVDVFIIVKALADKYPDAVDLICQNHGEMIFKLADPTTEKCVEKLWGDVMEHMVPFVSEPKLISHLTQAQCETFSQLRQYIEAKLNVCKAPDLVSVYDLFHNTLFSVTTCRNYVLTVSETDLLAVTHAMPQSGSDSSSEDSVDSREIKQESPETSGFMDDIHVTSRNSSDSNEAHDGQTEELKAENMCAKTTVKLENLMLDIDTLSNETRTAFFSQYCPRLERTALCMIEDLKAKRPNFEEDVFIIFKALRDNYLDAVDMVCKNDGEILFKLADTATKKCVKKLWDDVMEREERLKSKNEHWDISNLTKAQCERFSEMRNYIEDNLIVCKIPDLVSVYDLFYNTLFSVTTCRNLLVSLHEVTHAMPQPGSDLSSENSAETPESIEESPETSGFMDDIRVTSRNSSDSDEAHADQTEDIKAENTCATTKIDLDRFLADIDTLSNETRTAFFSQYCPRLERTALCMIDDLKAKRPYFEEGVFIIVKALRDNFLDAVDLICKNDGEIIFKLADPTTKKCVEKLWDGVVEREERLKIENEHLDISNLTKAQCEAYFEMRNYIEDKLNVCKIPDLVSVNDLFYNTLFSVTTCRNYVLTVSEADLLAVAHAMPQSGYDSSSGDLVDTREIKHESPETSGFMDDIHVTSRNSSESDEAQDDQIEAMLEAKMCVKTAFNNRFLSDIDTLSNKTRTAFFSQYCPRLHRTVLCMMDLVKAVRSDFKEDYYMIVKASDHYLDAVDLICENNGEAVFKLADPTTKKCFEQLWNDVMEHMEMFADEVKHWDISQLTHTQCETLSGLRQYVEGKLNVCQAADLMTVYDLFYNTLFSHTTCGNYVLTVTDF